VGLSPRESTPAASSWILVASRDVLRENLSAVHQGQSIMGAIFVVLVPLVAALNAVALPDSFNQWVPVATPPPSFADGESPEPPVWMEIKFLIPRDLVALATASLLVVLYHTVSCIALPAGLLTSTAVSDLCKPSVWSAAANSRQRRLLKSLFWLRQAAWALVASLAVAGSGFAAAVLLFERPRTAQPGFYDYYDDWRRYKDDDVDASGNARPLVVSLGESYVLAAAASLAVQLLLAVVWTAAATSSFPAAAASSRRVAPRRYAEELVDLVSVASSLFHDDPLEWQSGAVSKITERLVGSRSRAQRKQSLPRPLPSRQRRLSRLRLHRPPWVAESLICAQKPFRPMSPWSASVSRPARMPQGCVNTGCLWQARRAGISVFPKRPAARVYRGRPRCASR
jgi:hypothetical protein